MKTCQNEKNSKPKPWFPLMINLLVASIKPVATFVGSQKGNGCGIILGALSFFYFLFSPDRNKTKNLLKIPGKLRDPYQIQPQGVHPPRFRPERARAHSARRRSAARTVTCASRLGSFKLAMPDWYHRETKGNQRKSKGNQRKSKEIAVSLWKPKEQFEWLFPWGNHRKSPE